MILRLQDDPMRLAPSIEIRGDMVIVWNPPRRRAPGALLDEPDPAPLAALLNGHAEASQLMTAYVAEAALVVVERPRSTMVTMSLVVGRPP